MIRDKFRITALAAVLISATGCSLLIPEKALKPVIRNPFPQLSRVAVAPFFNQSDEPTVDGRQVAMAYFAELQSTPGFEVVPVGVTEEAIIANHIDLSGPGEARRLAQILGVDAVAIGTITDFSEYYPPRMGLRVEWYTSNPGYHEIPAGYGLPWCTPEEEFIPDSLVYESQMALAKAQMKSLTPDCEGQCQTLPAPPGGAPLEGAAPDADGSAIVLPPQSPAPVEAEPAPAGAPMQDDQQAPRDENPWPNPESQGADYDPFDGGASLAQAQEELPAAAAQMPAADPLPAPREAGKVNPLGATAAAIAGAAAGAVAAPQSPVGQAACPSPACAAGRPPCNPYNGPVLSHTRIYHGNDADVVDALEGYVSFRADDRFGGWKSYLDRSDDYIRFCCRMHISEMLSARGGSRKMQVVWRWPESR